MTQNLATWSLFILLVTSSAFCSNPHPPPFNTWDAHNTMHISLPQLWRQKRHTRQNNQRKPQQPTFLKNIPPIFLAFSWGNCIIFPHKQPSINYITTLRLPCFDSSAVAWFYLFIYGFGTNYKLDRVGTIKGPAIGKTSKQTKNSKWLFYHLNSFNLQLQRGLEWQNRHNYRLQRNFPSEPRVSNSFFLPRDQ